MFREFGFAYESEIFTMLYRINDERHTGKKTQLVSETTVEK
jgi:hypothetical protein